MNISKLHKFMLLLVVTATVVSQAQAGWLDDFRAQFNPKVVEVVAPVIVEATPEVKATWLQSGLKMAKVPFGYIANGASYVSGKAMEYPKTSLGIAAATVMVPAFAYGYKKFTSPAPKKSAPKKSAQGNSKVKTAVKYGLGLGTVAGLSFGAYKAFQNGYLDFASPFVSTTGRKIATGLGLATLAGTPFAVKAFGGKSDDKQTPEQKEQKQEKKQLQKQEQDKKQVKKSSVQKELAELLADIKINANNKIDNADEITDVLLVHEASFREMQGNLLAVEIADACNLLEQQINKLHEVRSNAAARPLKTGIEASITLINTLIAN